MSSPLSTKTDVLKYLLKTFSHSFHLERDYLTFDILIAHLKLY